ncbi:hypothetical protein SmJEL517_g01016 [Synchytrium microbalum]|uniref:Myb-like domain-containing protein n=1 Tax=Synchytrium microbalum TaxID=1806994 RepID=A0A507CCA8_9FUNG|nr:uncharacterized protein SmJEL517_g01016 [Synchytrium microbalum]TPX37131.1 hypothetical protein SmJEL517_g01016 [Synchytrium microbalum]
MEEDDSGVFEGIEAVRRNQHAKPRFTPKASAAKRKKPPASATLAVDIAPASISLTSTNELSQQDPLLQTIPTTPPSAPITSPLGAPPIVQPTLNGSSDHGQKRSHHQEDESDASRKQPRLESSLPSTLSNLSPIRSSNVLMPPPTMAQPPPIIRSQSPSPTSSQAPPTGPPLLRMSGPPRLATQQPPPMTPTGPPKLTSRTQGNGGPSSSSASSKVPSPDAEENDPDSRFEHLATPYMTMKLSDIIEDKLILGQMTEEEERQNPLTNPSAPEYYIGSVSSATNKAPQQTAPQANAVQLTLVGGNFQVAHSSLLRQAEPEQRPLKVIEESANKHITSASFRKNPRAFQLKWTYQETELFYECLSWFGTDFGLILNMFPGRTRPQIKTKFNAEEKSNMPRVNAALANKKVPNDDIRKRIADLSGIRLAERTAGATPLLPLDAKTLAAAAANEAAGTNTSNNNPDQAGGSEQEQHPDQAGDTKGREGEASTTAKEIDTPEEEDLSYMPPLPTAPSTRTARARAAAAASSSTGGPTPSPRLAVIARRKKLAAAAKSTNKTTASTSLSGLNPPVRSNTSSDDDGSNEARMGISDLPGSRRHTKILRNPTIRSGSPAPQVALRSAVLGLGTMSPTPTPQPSAPDIMALPAMARLGGPPPLLRSVVPPMPPPPAPSTLSMPPPLSRSAGPPRLVSRATAESASSSHNINSIGTAQPSEPQEEEEELVYGGQEDRDEDGEQRDEE